MGRRIDHRAEFAHPADRVYAALTDEDCLRARLAKVGGDRSELVSFIRDDASGSVTAVMRQTIAPEYLPSVVKRITPGGVTIERTEMWEDGRHGGTVNAAVSGMPGSLKGTTAVSGKGTGAELVLNGEVSVSIPLVGGKIEAVIVEQLGRLLKIEARFTNRWLESN